MNNINISSSVNLKSRPQAKKQKKHKQKDLNLTKKSLMDRFILIDEEKDDKNKDQMNMYLSIIFIFLNRYQNSSKFNENDAGNINNFLINEDTSEDHREKSANNVFCFFNMHS